MKRITLAMTILLLMTGCNKTSNLYATTTVVTNIEQDTVYCEDFNGEVWTFTGAESWAIGDYCSMIMDNNGTQDIYDDKIISTRYSGWLNGTWGVATSK